MCFVHPFFCSVRKSDGGGEAYFVPGSFENGMDECTGGCLPISTGNPDDDHFFCRESVDERRNPCGEGMKPKTQKKIMGDDSFDEVEHGKEITKVLFPLKG